MDIVAITEISQKSNENFIKNVTIEAYIYSTGSHSAGGGVAIYVNNNFNSFERNDQKINNDEFESVWIEINKVTKILYVAVFIVIQGIIRKIFYHMLKNVYYLRKTKKFTFVVILIYSN